MRFFWAFPGLFAVVLYGLCLLVDCCIQTPPHRVTSCRREDNPDGKWVRVRYEDGTSEGIDIWRLDRDCLVPGTLVEKRRWELGWRLDGGEPMMLDAHSPGYVPLFFISCAWVVLAIGYGLWMGE